MELTDQAMQKLANLLGELFLFDRFSVYHGENEQDTILKMPPGKDASPEWLSVDKAFELLKERHNKLAEVCNRADLFILMVNSRVETK